MASHPAARNEITPAAPTGSLEALMRELKCAKRERDGCDKQVREIQAAIIAKRLELIKNHPTPKL